MEPLPRMGLCTETIIILQSTFHHHSHNMSLFEPAPEPPTSLGRYRVLSKTAGIRVSPLQLGAMSLGKAWEGMLGSMDKKGAFELLDAFVAAGGNFIDT